MYGPHPKHKHKTHTPTHQTQFLPPPPSEDPPALITPDNESLEDVPLDDPKNSSHRIQIDSPLAPLSPNSDLTSSDYDDDEEENNGSMSARSSGKSKKEQVIERDSEEEQKRNELEIEYNMRRSNSDPARSSPLPDNS